MLGFAIWASVSDDVDTKIREQIKGGVWPPKLNAEYWTNGEIAWLVDVVAQNAKTARSIGAALSQRGVNGRCYAHPVVRSHIPSVDLEKINKNNQDPEWRYKVHLQYLSNLLDHRKNRQLHNKCRH
jgi:hypothetical protein